MFLDNQILLRRLLLNNFYLVRVSSFIEISAVVDILNCLDSNQSFLQTRVTVSYSSNQNNLNNNLNRIKIFFCKKYSSGMIYIHTPTHCRKEQLKKNLLLTDV